MRKIPVDDERIDRIYSAMQMHGFIVVDHWGEELDRLCYRDFIEAMFSGNPNVNLITIHKNIMQTRQTRRRILNRKEV
mgnify:CR=1 FL=1